MNSHRNSIRKRFLKLLFCLCMAFSLMSAAVFAEEAGQVTQEETSEETAASEDVTEAKEVPFMETDLIATVEQAAEEDGEGTQELIIEQPPEETLEEEAAEMDPLSDRGGQKEENVEPDAVQESDAYVSISYLNAESRIERVNIYQSSGGQTLTTKDGGSISWEAQTNTLTLTNAALCTNEMSNSAIYSSDKNFDIKIKLVGANIITAPQGICVNGKLTIEGEGPSSSSLTIKGSTKYGIQANSELSTSNATVTVEQGYIDVRGPLSILGSNVSAHSSSYFALTVSGNLIIKDSTVTAEATDATNSYHSGIYVQGNNNITVENSTVTASSKNDNGICATSGNVYFNNSVVKSTASDKGYAAVYAGGSLFVKGGELTAISNGQPSCAVYAYTNINVSNNAKVTASSTGDSAIFACEGYLKVGNSTVDSTGYYCALQCIGGDLTISNSTIQATSTNDTAIYTPNTLKIENCTETMEGTARVTAKGYYRGLQGNSGIQISVSSVKAESTCDVAIWTNSASVSVTDSTLTAKGVNQAILANKDGGDISVTISNSKATLESSGSYGVDTTGTLAIRSGASVSVTGNSGGLSSSGSTTISGSKVEARVSDGYGIYSKDKIQITETSDVFTYGIYAVNGYSVTPKAGELADVKWGETQECEMGHLNVEDNPTITTGSSPTATSMNMTGAVNVYFHTKGHTHVYDQETASAEYKVSDADCYRPAKYYISCICGETGTETFESGAAKGHLWSSWRDAGDGEKHIRTCSRCGSRDTLTHKWDNGVVVTEATVVKNGLKTYTCTVCKATKDEVIPATGGAEHTQLPAVTGLKAVTTGMHRIQLTWDPVDGALGYIILGLNENGRSGVQIGYTAKTEWTDTEADSESFNFYWVLAFDKNAAGRAVAGLLGDYVWGIGVLVDQVSSLQAKGDVASVTLTWGEAENASAYVVLARRGRTGKAVKIATVTGTSYTYSTTAGTTYYWVYGIHKRADGKTVAAGKTSGYAWATVK